MDTTSVEAAGDQSGDACDGDDNGKQKPHQQVTVDIVELVKIIAQQQPLRVRGPPSNPAPLGLAAFAFPTFILSCFNTGVLIDDRNMPLFHALALWSGGVGQFIAGLIEFKHGNTNGGTTFCGYGIFWISLATLEQFIYPFLPPDKLYQAKGLFLLSWTIFTVYMLVASIRESRAILAIFVPLLITFIFLTVGNLAQSVELVKAGGWFGLLTALFAWYASAAGIINISFGKTVLPVGTYKRATKLQSPPRQPLVGEA